MMHCTLNYSYLEQKRAELEKELPTYPQMSDLLDVDRKLITILKSALELGSCVFCEGTNGDSVLHAAIRKDDSRMTAVLLALPQGKQAADRENSLGETPRTLAKLASEALSSSFNQIPLPRKEPPKETKPTTPIRREEESDAQFSKWRKELGLDKKIQTSEALKSRLESLQPKKETKQPALSESDQQFVIKSFKKRIANDPPEKLCKMLNSAEGMELCELVDENGQSAIHWAAERGNGAIFDEVRLWTPNFSSDELKVEVTLIPVKNGDLDFIKHMLNTHATSLRVYDSGGSTIPFHMILHGQEHMVRWFHQVYQKNRGECDIRDRNRKGHTLLHEGTQYEKDASMYRLVRELFPKNEFEFYASATDHAGLLPYELAIVNDRLDIVSYEFSKYPKKDYEIKRAISSAQKNGAEQVLIYLGSLLPPG